jgi:hypothetical protein
MKIKFLIASLLFVGLISSCKKDDSIPGDRQAEWTLPINEIFDGGPGIDGIPSLDLPNFINISEADYIEDDDLVVVFKNEEMVRAYPHNIMDWHEIVNDKVSNTDIAITYCPLTGTAIGWDRNVNGDVTEFGVSGLLYNSNLMPYDRVTRSTWSQMELECVSGNLIRTKINTIPLIETTWKTYKEWFPNGSVLSLNTGFNRNYDQFPYGDYKTNTNLFFSVNNPDDRLHPKERVLGVQDGELAKAYQFSHFEEGTSIINDVVNQANLVIIGNKEKNFMKAFDRILDDGTVLDFQVSEDNGVLMTDNEGNKWDYFGQAIEGPRKDSILKQPINYIGYWFSWATFQHDISIY